MLAAAVARPAGLLLRRALGRGPAALMATAPGSPPAEAWTETERYLFDLNGYLVVPQARRRGAPPGRGVWPWRRSPHRDAHPRARSPPAPRSSPPPR